MRFLKRIVYGVVVGTCIMMINHKCVKADNDYWNAAMYSIGSVSANSYNYDYSSDTFFHACLSGDDDCVQQDNVGYKITPSQDFSNNLVTYGGWDTNYFQKQSTFSDNMVYNFNHGSENKYATFISAISLNNYSTSHQNAFIRVDYDKFDFTVNNYLRFVSFDGTYFRSVSIFSENQLPSYSHVNGEGRLTINTNTVIVVQTFKSSPTNTQKSNINYVFRRLNIGDVVGGPFIYGLNYQYNCSYNSDNCIYVNNFAYFSNTDYVVGNSTLPANVPPDELFTVDWVKIDSTDDSEELYGNDNIVTSTNVGARFSPVDLTKYNYYLGFTNSDSCSDNLEDYTKMTSSDKGVLTIPNIKENGLVCAKITKVNTSNVIYTDTYTVDTVGKLSTFGFSNNKFSIFIDNLVNKLNYGGPISSLISIPLSLLSAIINAFNSSCSSYNMGTLMGHNIVFSCFNIQSILGSTITNVIDLLCSFTIYYHLILFIISIYRKIMNLDDLDDYIPKHIYQPKHGSY